MSLQARFSNLDGSSLPVQEGWQAQTCSWAAVGGPDEAILALEDPTPAALTSAGSLIGAGLELWDTARSLPAWWGRVTGLELQCGGLVQSLDLEGAANRVAVSYLQTAPGQSGGRPALTAWAEEPVSLARFGRQERILGLGASSQSRAEALREAALARLAFPISSADWQPGRENSLRLVLRARGWWRNLYQRYLALPSAREECRPAGAGVQSVGESAANQKIAQRIMPTFTGWRAVELWLLVRRQGSPADALRLELARDAGGIPGSVLSTQLVPAAGLPTDFRWVCLSLPQPVEISGPLWIVLSRSGGLSSAAYYRLLVDESNSYPGGSLWVWTGSAWIPRSPAADLGFQLAGEMETSRQMLRLASAGVPPLTGALALQDSGLFGDPYCSGLRPAGEELERLMEAGGAGVRWLARVTPGRMVVFYPQPSPALARLRLDVAGGLTLPGGITAAPSDALAGEWAQVESLFNGLPGAALFVEHITWRAGSGLRLE